MARAWKAIKLYDANMCRSEDFSAMQPGDIVKNATHGGILEVLENYGTVQKVRLLESGTRGHHEGDVCLWSDAGLEIISERGCHGNVSEM